MNEQSHIVTGIYTSRVEAGSVRERLVAAGLPAGQIDIVEHAGIGGNGRMAADDETVKDALVDGAVGAAVGTVLGGLGHVALVAANVTLFVASPVVAPLAMLGWGAFVGGFVGAAAGIEKPEKEPAKESEKESEKEVAEKKEGKLSELVLDVIRSGHVALIVRTTTSAETTLVRALVGDSIARQT